MVIAGWPLYIVVTLLTLWFLLLCRTCWRLIKVDLPTTTSTTRSRLTVAGIIFSTIAVAALLALHLSWISVEASQHLGDGGIRVLALFLFWLNVAGLVFSTVGSGRMRFLGIGSSVATGIWWFTLWMVAAISMGSPPMARHPVVYLVPDGYVGWITIKHGENAPRLELSNGKYICRIPASGILSTSFDQENGWATDEYFYSSEDGSYQSLPNTGWGGGGMIWAGRSEWQSADGSKPKQFLEKFYVGKEDQYNRNESHPPKGKPAHQIS